MSDTSVDQFANSADVARARFHQTFLSNLDRTYRLAGLILGNSQDAEDAVQDALLVAWRSLDTLRDPQRFPAWLDRILVNVCRDRLRRRRVVRFLTLDEGLGAETTDPFAEVLARDDILRHVAILPLDERLIVFLHYWADLPLDGVAARLDIPVGTVKSRLHRALARMRSAAAAKEALA